MKAELQKQLFDKYPKIFGQKDLPMDQTCMCWGIDCDDGWFWLLDNLCFCIQRYCDSFPERGQVEASQVKEKYAGLRFYIGGGDSEVDGMISLAEDMSYTICEVCGSTKNVKVRGTSWVKTLCNKCDKKLKLNSRYRRFVRRIVGRIRWRIRAVFDPGLPENSLIE